MAAFLVLFSRFCQGSENHGFINQIQNFGAEVFQIFHNYVILSQHSVSDPKSVLKVNFNHCTVDYDSFSSLYH